MARLTINIGQSANDKNGDALRTAFEKVNANFTELYAGGANETQLTNGSKTVTLGTDGNLTLSNGSKINQAGLNDIELVPGSAIGAASLGSYDSKNYMWVDNTGAYVYTNLTNQWSFGTNGRLTFPDGTVQKTAGVSKSFAIAMSVGLG